MKPFGSRDKVGILVGWRQLGKFGVEPGWKFTCWGGGREADLDFILSLCLECKSRVFEGHGVVFRMEVAMEESHVLLYGVKCVLYFRDIVHIVEDDTMALDNAVNGSLAMDWNGSDAVTQDNKLLGLE